MRSRLAARRRGLQRPTLSLWTCFRAPPKSSRWIGPMSPTSLELRSSTSGSSSVHIPSLKGGSCHFSAIWIERSPVPGSSHFPPALVIVSRHRDIVLGHIHSLGLRMNAKKSVLLPSQRTVFLGVRLDSVQMQACLAPARISDLTACLARFKLGHHVSVGTSEWILTLKVVLLLAFTSLKRVGDLQAFSVSETCMDFAPGLVKVTLPPRPGYIPKVLSTSFQSQVVTLHSFHPPPFASSEDERLHMLSPVRALKLYVDRSKVWRKSPQLLMCFGAGRRRLATSKQRISHWVRDAISLAYEARKLPSPLSLWVHSTRGVASSQALFRGVPLEDICVAAGWSSPHTFVRFYNLDVDTAPGSQVLSVWTDRTLLVIYWTR